MRPLTRIPLDRTACWSSTFFHRKLRSRILTFNSWKVNRHGKIRRSFVRPALSQPPDWNSTGVGRQATTTDQEQTNEAAEDRHCQEQHKTEIGRACRLLRNEAMSRRTARAW